MRSPSRHHAGSLLAGTAARKTVFDQWAAASSEGLRSGHADGKLPSDIDPDDLATTLLATLQEGLLLAQVQRSSRPFETAVDTLLALTIGR